MILTDPTARPIIAHRGASARYPENTLLAFHQALQAGADALEFDVRVTADGVPVVIHDETVDRTTSESGPVAARTYREVRTLDAGGGERIPCLDDVLEAWPDLPLLIEVKEAQASTPTAAALQRHRAQHRVLVGAFEHATLARFGSGFHRSASTREVRGFWMAARCRALRWGGRYDAFSLPERWGRITVVSPAFVRLARRMRKPVHVWTVDEPARANRLWAMGVSGIVTNCPERWRGAPRT